MSLAYPDYQWVDTAFGDWRHRNRPMIISDLRTALPADPRDCFATWHRFPKAYAKHVQDRGTVSGYDGASYADFLPIDFDGEDLGQVQQQVKEFLRVLEVNLEVDGLQGVRVFFSGAKGFHVCLSSALFGGWKPSVDLPRMLKELAQRITEGFETDPAIYDQNRLLRLANTVNSKSGLWKVPLPAGEVIRETIDTIVDELAQQPREVTWAAWDDVTASPVWRSHVGEREPTGASRRATAVHRDPVPHRDEGGRWQRQAGIQHRALLSGSWFSRKRHEPTVGSMGRCADGSIGCADPPAESEVGL